MPDFKDHGYIYIQPNTAQRPVALSFPACSAATENDGAIPYGTTISDASVVSMDADGATVADLIVTDSVSVTGDTTLGLQLQYPSTSGDGVYTLEARLTLDTGAVLVFDAKRVVAGDRST